MENYFIANKHAPVLLQNPTSQKHINVEPLFTAMFELADEGHQHSPKALSAILDQGIRYLATNVPPMDTDQVRDFHKMMDRLYDLRDMFEAMVLS